MLEAMSNPIVSQLIGLVIGLVTSFFSWWVLFHGIAPKIKISPKISKTLKKPADEHTESRYAYKFKFENTTRRSIHDVEIRARVRIKGLTFRETWSVANLLVGTTKEYIHSIPFMSPVKKSALGTVMPLWVNYTPRFLEEIYPEDIRTKAEAHTLTLEDVLALGTAAQLIIHISGTDGFTGSRKYFRKKYTISDIKEGPFFDKGLGIASKMIKP